MAVVLFVLGAAAVVTGCALVSVPAAFITGGGLALAAAVDLTRRGESA